MTTRIGPYPINSVIHGHALEVLSQLPANSIHATITSPPYFGLRDYGIEPVFWPEMEFYLMAGLPEITIPEQICCLGLEKDIWSYVGHLVAIFREVKRVLRDDGTLWLNLGDSYAGSWGNYGARDGNQRSRISERWHRPAYENAENGYRDKPPTISPGPGLKNKDLIGIPWRVALALQADGWYLRNDIIWSKTNPMPESVRDRLTKAHEYVFLMSKSDRYYFDQEAIKEPTVRPGDIQTFGGSKARAGDDPRNNGRMDEARQWGKDYETKETRNRRTVWTIFQDTYDTFKEWLSIQPEAAQYTDLTEMLVDRFNEERSNKLDVWQVATRPYTAAHFATFPPNLIEPMILASTSEYGCCGSCGNPWQRMIERAKDSLPVEERHGRTGHNGQPPQISGNYWTGPTTKATGQWQPTCNCESGISPAIVLDPFFGSGTVGQVAAQNRRHYLGFELNEDYLELAPNRVTTQVKMF